MFDGDVAELDTDAALTVAAQLRATADRAEARLLEVAAHFADLHPVPRGQRHGVVILPGMENVFVCGGEGCPDVAEFAPAELGAALGVSTSAATALLEDALALRHRLPRTWLRVLAGEVQAWRARRIARATRPLTRDAAGLVDARVSSIADTLTPYRLERIVEAAVMDADPAAAQANADAVATQRGVWVAQSDLHGTKTMVVKAGAGDVIRLDARTQQIADTLAALGDTDTLDQRRAKAIGWLADPQAALDLITGSDASMAPDAADQHRTDGGPMGQSPQQHVRHGSTGRASAPHTLYVHLTDQALLSETGLVRADQCGPLLASQLSELLGHDRIVVKPVIDLRDRIAVDAYEIPQRIREHVLLRHTHCIFPWCNRPAGPRTDLDHIVPYDDTGPPGQTATDTVAPECRLHHRIKTFGAWRCCRTPDGAYEWTSPLDRRYRVDHTGTHSLASSADETSSREDEAA
jgi:Domain of unknown function (DUF222)